MDCRVQSRMGRKREVKQDEVWKNPDELKKEWNASLPYPSWPFGVVDPKELAKWSRRNKIKDDALADVEDAPF